MSGKKPRKPKPILRNPFERAIDGARKISPMHRENIFGIIDKAWKMMLAGESRKLAWCDLVFASNMASELSDLGICSDDASVKKIGDAQDVLIRFAGYANDWSKLTLTDEDCAIMEEAIFLYGVQLDFVCVSEFETARRRVNVATDQARRGNVSKTTTVINLSA